MQIPFAPLSYDREGFGLPGTLLRNMFPEGTPPGPAKSAHFPRPCLKRAYSVGTAGTRGIYQQDGVFGGDIFTVSGTVLYRRTSSVGNVALGTYAAFAATYTQLVVVSGGKAYVYDGDTLEEIDIPDDQAVADVFVLGARFFFVIEGSDVWYFSDIDDASTVNALSFATADSAPDASLGAIVIGDQAVFFGRTSVEFWAQTGNQDAPLIRQPGSTYPKGCVSRRSVVATDNRAFWVGNDLKVYTLGNPDKVSTHAIDQLLRECSTPDAIHGFAVTWDGHDFLVLNIPGQGTVAMHIESGQWTEWTSAGRSLFRCGCAAMVGSTAYLGDNETGAVFKLADVAEDDGEPVEFVATVIAPAGPIDTLELEAAVGVGPEDGSDALVEMRYSLDRGRTFTAWRPKSLGRIGATRTRPRWRNLGDSRWPRPIQFRSTSPVRVVFAAVRINEP